MPEIDYQKQGAKNRKKGQKFEVFVRKALEDEGWVVTKWLNQIDLITGEISQAKPKFNPFTKRVMAIGTGFPDFLAMRPLMSDCINYEEINVERKAIRKEVLAGYENIGVESKSNGSLTAEEKDKCRLYLQNKTFSRILIARKKIIKGKTAVILENFEEKYGLQQN